jgi:precorrin-6Y C5,15-methyltransferase (decarboxylating)
MYDICLFAGTTEGRRLAQFLRGTGLCAYVSVATEYGETLIPGSENVVVHAGRLDQPAMEELFKKERFSLVIDATHPYATAVTANIAAAAAHAGVELIRLLREEDDKVSGAVYVSSISEAAEYLKNTAGNVLLTTGSKELTPFASIPGARERIFARVLPMQSSLESCQAAGIPPAHIIAMQGPFSQEMNCALLRMTQARYMVTKDSGANGGFRQKIAAAQAEGVQIVIIGRPRERSGMEIGELTRLLCSRFGIAERPRVSVVGLGMGNPALLTGEAQAALAEAECIIGAKRMVNAVAAGRPFFASMDNGKITEFIRSHPEYRSYAIVMSGDTGFYSGAKKLLPLLAEYEPQICPGISSLQYLCARAATSWDDAYVISLHGREGSALPAVTAHRKVFALVGGAGGAKHLLEELCAAGLGQVKAIVGERLSYPDEKITEGTAEELRFRFFDSLCALLLQNKDARPPRRAACLPDEAFLRTSNTGATAPMTKAEVRAVSVAKLMLEENSVVYDIGAGTGSVSVEMAGICTAGQVYAIECKEEAVSLLEQNKKRFGLFNLTVVEGFAPDACAQLPPPTHAFIGGTSGNMQAVLEMLLKKNPTVRIVINLIALESIAQTMCCLESLRFENPEVVQVSIAKARKLGRYHLMNGQNPIMIISCQKESAETEEKEMEDTEK